MGRHQPGGPPRPRPDDGRGAARPGPPWRSSTPRATDPWSSRPRQDQPPQWAPEPWSARSAREDRRDAGRPTDDRRLTDHAPGWSDRATPPRRRPAGEPGSGDRRRGVPGEPRERRLPDDRRGRPDERRDPRDRGVPGQAGGRGAPRERGQYRDPDARRGGSGARGDARRRRDHGSPGAWDQAGSADSPPRPRRRRDAPQGDRAARAQGTPERRRRPAPDRRATASAAARRGRRTTDPWDADATEILPATRKRPERTLGAALLITGASTLVPGAGHLILRRRAGWVLLAGFVLSALVGAWLVLGRSRTELVEFALTSNVLSYVVIAFLLGMTVWLAVIVHTWMLARPRPLDSGKRALGGAVVAAMCLVIATPFGYAAHTVNSSRSFIDSVFPSAGGADGKGAPAGDEEAIKKPRINILLLGSDAGEGRIGTRTDTMVVASIDTKSGATTLFSLPRNMARAPFEAGSPAAQEYPNGFYDRNDPHSANYLLNAIYTFGADRPDLAPDGPSNEPGLNLLYQTIGNILGLQLDFYITVNLQGFAAIVDALGGLDVNVGSEPVPIGGIGPFGEAVRPKGYIDPGLQHLDGEKVLAFTRSRTNSTDYVRMGRQRCVLQWIIDQKSPTDVLMNFQAVASATQDSVSTNIPQELLGPLVTLAGKAKERPMESIAFDPSLPDPGQADGQFDTGNPDYAYVRRIVQDALAPRAEPAPTSEALPPPPQPGTTTQPGAGAGTGTAVAAPPSTSADGAPLPTSLAATCNGG